MNNPCALPPRRPRSLPFPLFSILILGCLLALAPRPAPGQAADVDPPTLLGLSFDPQLVDVTASSATVTFALEVEDDAAGVDLVGSGLFGFPLTLTHRTTLDEVTFSPDSIVRTDANPGDLHTVWEVGISVPASMTEGEWDVSGFYLWDKALRVRHLDATALQAFHLPPLTVISPPDASPPVLVDWEFLDENGAPVFQPVVDTSAGAAFVRARLHVTDVGRGVDPQEFAAILAPPPPVVWNNSDTAGQWLLVSGTPQDGVWEGHFHFPRYSPEGLWTPAGVSISDYADHVLSDLTESAVEARIKALPTQPFTVDDLDDLAGLAQRLDKPMEGDLVASWLMGALSPTTQQGLTDLASQAILSPTLEADLVADLNGIVAAGDSLLNLGIFDWNTFQPATAELAAIVGQLEGKSLLRLNRLLLEDALPGALIPSPAPVSNGVWVTSQPSDVLPPVIRAVRISPSAINTSASAQQVTVQFQIEDDLSGISGAELAVISPSGSFLNVPVGYLPGPGDTQPDPAHPLRWQVTRTLVFPRNSAIGLWRVYSLMTTDQAGNVGSLDPRNSGPNGEPDPDLAAEVLVVPAEVSLVADGTLTPGGGTVFDQDLDARARITAAPGAVAVNTPVAIDVYETAPEIALPQGFVAAGTPYVSFHPEPQPAYPLRRPDSPWNYRSPWRWPRAPPCICGGSTPISDQLEPSLDVAGIPVVGVVDPTGLSAVFPGVSRLSTIVGLTSDIGIQWANPADITYGTALTAAQLNASADVPGSFSYSPPLGTVLPAGPNQILAVTFTASDAQSYPTPVVRWVSLRVAPATLAVTAEDKSMTVGGPLPAFTARYSGFVNGENESILLQSPVLDCAATESSPAGTYEIGVSGAVAPNYEIQFVPGTLTVTAAETVDLAPTAYPPVASRRVGPTVWEYSFRVVLANRGDGTAGGVSAQLIATAVPGVTLIQDTVVFGDIAGGASATSQNVFTIRVDRARPVRAQDLSWTLQYSAPSGASAIIPNVPY
jgi:hypothetical protein